VTIEDNRLTISGKRSFETVGDKNGYHRKEIFEGSFTRTMLLPDSADADAVTATSKEGILEVRIPTLAAALPRKVKVDITDITNQAD